MSCDCHCTKYPDIQLQVNDKIMTSIYLLWYLSQWNSTNHSNTDLIQQVIDNVFNLSFIIQWDTETPQFWLNCKCLCFNKSYCRNTNSPFTVLSLAYSVHFREIPCLASMLMSVCPLTQNCLFENTPSHPTEGPPFTSCICLDYHLSCCRAFHLSPRLSSRTKFSQLSSISGIPVWISSLPQDIYLRWPCLDQIGHLQLPVFFHWILIEPRQVV